MSKELIERLRDYLDEDGMWRKGLNAADIIDAADIIEQQAAEIARLRENNRMLGYELEGALQDEKMGLFDDICRETISRVRAALAGAKPQQSAD